MKLLFILVLIVNGCALKKTKETHAPTPAKPIVREKFEPRQLKIFPGQIRYLEVNLAGTGFTKGKLLCAGEKLPAIIKKGKLRAYIRYSYFSPVKDFSCVLKNRKEVLTVANLEMDQYQYQSERLRVDKKRLFPSKNDQKRIWKEQKVLNKIYASSPPIFYFDQPFKEPLSSFVTSKYGKKRIYNNKKQSQHLGTDYRAAVGVKIPAANKGRIVLARDLFYTGNTVILDHGLGIFTVYGHLSKLLVREGDFAQKDQIIGEAGMTGRVTGPHLHWGVKVNGQYIDGPMLVKESRRQFKNIE